MSSADERPFFVGDGERRDVLEGDDGTLRMPPLMVFFGVVLVEETVGDSPGSGALAEFRPREKDEEADILAMPSVTEDKEEDSPDIWPRPFPSS